MGKEVVDQLKRSGKIDEAKRKCASIAEMEGGQVRLKRGMDTSALPAPREEPYTPDPGNHSSWSHPTTRCLDSPSTTPPRSDTAPRNSIPTAPKAMLTHQHRDISLPPSATSDLQHLSSPKRDIPEQVPSTSPILRDDVSVSISVTPKQAADSPRSNQVSPTLSKPGPNRNSQPPDVPFSRHDSQGTEPVG